MAENPNNRRYVNLHQLGDDVRNCSQHISVLALALQSASRMADPEKRRVALQNILRDAVKIKDAVDKAMFDLDIALPEDMQ